MSHDPWRDFGAVVFASSKFREKAIERDVWQNGAFTEALLEAFRQPSNGVDPAAPIVRDHLVSAMELKQYLHERIPELTDDKQHASSNWPLELDDFNLAGRSTTGEAASDQAAKRP